MSDTLRSSSASSVDGDHVAATATSKHGRAAAPPSSSQSWLQWLSDKYTIQYSIPPTYAPAASRSPIRLSRSVSSLALSFRERFHSSSPLSTHLRSLQLRRREMPWWAFPQLHLYLFAWVAFHMLEFTVTASYNPTRSSRTASCSTTAYTTTSPTSFRSSNSLSPPTSILHQNPLPLHASRHRLIIAGQTLRSMR